MKFKCPRCAAETTKSGLCALCNKEVERVCPACNEAEEFCTCQSSRIQSKGGHGKGKAKIGVKAHGH